MTPNDVQTFNQAISLAQSGKQSEAYLILLKMAQSYPEDSNLLLWLAFTAPELSISRQLLDRIAYFDPANTSLASAKEWLASEEAKHAVPVGVPMPPFAAQTAKMVAQPAPAPAKPEPLAPKATPANSKASKPETKTPGNEKDKEEQEKTGPDKAFVILTGVGGLMVLGIVALVVMLFLGVFKGDAMADKGLPVYSNAARLELKSDTRDAMKNLFTGLGFGLFKNVEIELYTVKTGERNKALKFYDDELKKQGWKISPEGSSNGARAYYKDNKFFVVGVGDGVSGEINVAGDMPKINPGDAMMLAFYGESDLIKKLT